MRSLRNQQCEHNVLHVDWQLTLWQTFWFLLYVFIYMLKSLPRIKKNTFNEKTLIGGYWFRYGKYKM